MVSVILVNYNGAKDTIECISSIEKTAETEYRIIVVDNKSTDESIFELREAQKKYQFDLIESPENKGFSAGNNIGICKAISLGTDYVWLLNNDTLVESSTMSQLMNGFCNSPLCGMTIGKILFEGKKDTVWYAGGTFNKGIARTIHDHYGEKDNSHEKEMHTVSFATGCCMLISRKAIEKVGLMDEDYFLYEEDTDYCLRFVNCGFEIKYVPQAIIYHKVSASTGASSPLSQYYACRNKYLLIKKNYKGIGKIIPFLFNTAHMVFRCIKKEINFEYYKKGFIAFCNGETGKREKNI